jgi:hypothetical protein
MRSLNSLNARVHNDTRLGRSNAVQSRGIDVQSQFEGLSPDNRAQLSTDKGARAKVIIRRWHAPCEGDIVPAFRLLATTQWREQDKTGHLNNREYIWKTGEGSRIGSDWAWNSHNPTGTTRRGRRTSLSRLGWVFAYWDGEKIILGQQVAKTAVEGDESGCNANSATSLANRIVLLEVGYHT